MSQHIPDRPPVDRGLRRRTDRLQCVVGWFILAATLCTLVGAGLAAAATYRDGLDRIQQDAAARTSVTGVLLDDALPADPGSGLPVRISYADQAGRAHVVQMVVTGRMLAGTPVRIEVDGQGRVGVPPPSRGDAVLGAASVAVGTTLLGGLLLGLTWVGVRCAVSARNHAAWAREWRWIEPQWSGRGTAAP
jgi:hypothetical protein